LSNSFFTVHSKGYALAWPDLTYDSESLPLFPQDSLLLWVLYPVSHSLFTNVGSTHFWTCSFHLILVEGGNSRICSYISIFSLITYVTSMLFVCLWILPYQLLYGWTNLCKIWYVCHGTWAYLSGVVYKSLSSVCVSVYASPRIVARQWLGKHFPEASKNWWRYRFQCGPYVSNESARLVLPRIYCLFCSHELSHALKISPRQPVFLHSLYLHCPRFLAYSWTISALRTFMKINNVKIIKYIFRFSILGPK
jgi:hypothetical protein